ncbi:MULTISPECIES: LutC/YkgG family protein [Halolamina]|uniref:L-lactate dehydrogenase complex protein LldG n=1 Tax=Halolamina pelagica TaxID=699431 RepID=A0A1I5TPH1_9EURY|nr:MULTISPECIES: lactate utilization protein C [Halolamina]NHX37757.1 lactate utilization protein C [Halolamina sp. R1-12]SFP84933.1 L-lactate dehydrogenase complex protein LldG [Halolamina pelagica]
MSAEPIATFASSLEDLGVDLVRTAADEFASTVAPLLDAPAVGTPLPFESATLPDSVETDPTVAELEAAATGVTAAGYGIADYGSVVVQGGADGAEPVSLYADEHVAVVAASDVLPDMDAAFDRLAEDVRSGTRQSIVATGPSATADMGSLVEGAHGPMDVTVVLLEDR